MRNFAIASLALALMGCPRPQPPGPGPELSDGCYFLGEQPVLKVSGAVAKVLIDGEVKQLKVGRSRTPDVNAAIFSPGIRLREKPLYLMLDPKFPRAYYMMAPSAGAPRLMIPTASGTGVIVLTRGSNC